MDSNAEWNHEGFVEEIRTKFKEYFWNKNDFCLVTISPLSDHHARGLLPEKIGKEAREG